MSRVTPTHGETASGNGMRGTETVGAADAGGDRWRSVLSKVVLVNRMGKVAKRRTKAQTRELLADMGVGGGAIDAAEQMKTHNALPTVQARAAPGAAALLRHRGSGRYLRRVGTGGRDSLVRSFRSAHRDDIDSSGRTLDDWDGSGSDSKAAAGGWARQRRAGMLQPLRGESPGSRARGDRDGVSSPVSALGTDSELPSQRSWSGSPSAAQRKARAAAHDDELDALDALRPRPAEQIGALLHAREAPGAVGVSIDANSPTGNGGVASGSDRRLEAVGAGGIDPETVAGSSVPVLMVDEHGATDQSSHRTHRCAERLAYWIDRRITQGRGKTFGLVLVAMLQVLVGGALLFAGQSLDESRDQGFGDAMWRSWTYVADPGTHAIEASWAGRVISFFITCGGILFFAALVGFVVDKIRSRMEELKKGKSRVIETGHYLILGWTDKSFTLLVELALAMESEGGGVIVILAEREKDELELEIREHFGGLSVLGTEIVCRSGSPILLSELSKVSAAAARSIVVLADNASDADKSDAKVLRIILSIVGMKVPPQGHVVAELRDIDNGGLVEIVGRSKVETIVSHDLIGRLMIKCARQPGLAKAYDAFLGFEGDEFYLSNWSELTGVAFADLLTYFPDAVAVGIKRDGDVILNPPRDCRVRDTDQILFLAEDDDTYAPCPPQRLDVKPGPAWTPPPRRAEVMLMSGWRRDVDDIICLLDALVEPGSELHMLCDLELPEREKRLREGGLDVSKLQNLRLHHHIGNPAFRRSLEALPLERFSSVLILSDESLEHDSMHSDSACLASLLLTRHIQELRFFELEAEAEASAAHAAPVDDGSGSEMGSARLGVHAEAAEKTKGADGGLGSEWQITRVPSGRALEVGPGAAAGASATPSSHTTSAAHQRKRKSSNPLMSVGSEEERLLHGDTYSNKGPRSRASSVDTADLADELARYGGASEQAAHATSGPVRATAAAQPAVRGNASRGNSIVPGSAAAIAANAAVAARPVALRSAVQPRESSGPTGAAEAKSASASEAAEEVAVRSPARCVMCCELLDSRTRGVVEDNGSVAILSDFILSNNIMSRVLAMVAERREVKSLLVELLGPAGQDIAIAPVTKYVDVRNGEEVSFWEISVRAGEYGEIPLGYKRAGAPHIVTNPPNKAAKQRWDVDDTIVVMASSELEERDVPVARAPGLSRASTRSMSIAGSTARARRSITAADADWVRDRVTRRESGVSIGSRVSAAGSVIGATAGAAL